MEKTPQTEHGYARIANEILDALCRYRISGEQMQCLLLILRKTYGWNRKTAEIGLKEFVEGTGIPKKNVNRVLNKLHEKGLIFILKNEDKTNPIYEFNKKIKDWFPSSKMKTASSKMRINKIQVPSLINDSIIKEEEPRGTTILKNEDKPSSKMKISILKNEDDQTSIHYIKDNKDIIKDIPPIVPQDDFLMFWKAYPKKVGKLEAIKAWKKLNGTRPDIQIILKAIEDQKQSAQWNKNAGQYIPNPTTWLNQGRWSDEPMENKFEMPERTRRNIDTLKRFISKVENHGTN